MALGEYEAGFPLGPQADPRLNTGYRPRLAPYVLLVKTSAFRSLGAPFRGFSWTYDAEDQRRWLAISDRLCFQPSDLHQFRTLAIYTTGAYFFERHQKNRLPWMATPGSIRRKYFHIGHMSIIPLDSKSDSGRELLDGYYANRLDYVHQRLALYLDPS